MSVKCNLLPIFMFGMHLKVLKMSLKNSSEVVKKLFDGIKYNFSVKLPPQNANAIVFIYKSIPH